MNYENQKGFSKEPIDPLACELSGEDIDLMIYLGSNHPRRRQEFLSGNTSPNPALSRKKVMELINSHKNGAYLSIELYLRYFKRILKQRTWRGVQLLRNSSMLFLVCGDSHAEFLSRIMLTDKTSRALTYYLGPLLAYSYSTRDYISQNVEMVATRLLERLHCRHLVLILSVGEIDIRCHSWVQVNLYRNYADVEEYSKALAAGVVSRTRMLVDLLKQNNSFDDMTVVIIEPSPPGRRAHTEPTAANQLEGLRAHREFPTFGPLEFRLAAQAAYLTHLRSLIAPSDRHIQIVELHKDCSDVDGSLAAVASYDGCHVSSPWVIAENFKNIIEASQLRQRHKLSRHSAAPEIRQGDI